MYHLEEHASEIELSIEDSSPEAVFAEAMVAIGDLLAEAPRSGEAVTHVISVRAADLPALLAAWIEELVRLGEVDGFIAQRIERLELEGATLEAVVGGECSVPQSLIKEVSYHRLEMKRTDGSWRARVLLGV